MKNPIIGITLDFENNSGYSKFPWYAIRENYLTSLHKFGAIPFPLFHTSSVNSEFIKTLDGLVITGGNFDIDPSLYAKSMDGSRNIKSKRTNFEIEIFNKFLETSKPILGICGGEQLINVVCGGTLIQDILEKNPNALEHEQPNPRNKTSHIVKIKKNTKIIKILKKNSIKVNSAHHQSVDTAGKNIIISGIAPDGTIEAIEHLKHRWCIGVQWHPEFLITNEDKLLIKNFIKISKKK